MSSPTYTVCPLPGRTEHQSSHFHIFGQTNCYKSEMNPLCHHFCAVRNLERTKHGAFVVSASDAATLFQKVSKELHVTDL